MLFPAASIAQTKDAALWASYSLDRKLSKQFYWHFSTQYRINENFTRFDYMFYDIGLNFKPTKNIEIEGAYVWNFKNSTRRKGLDNRHQFYTNAILGFNVGDFKINNRNRFQSSLEDENLAAEPDGLPDFFYRNKTTVRYKALNEIMPFIYSEFYFRLNHKQIWEDPVYRTRYGIGLEYKISKRKRIELYYMIQRQIRRKQPDYIYVIGIGFEQTIK